jgi:hypothetical protein
MNESYAESHRRCGRVGAASVLTSDLQLTFVSLYQTAGDPHQSAFASAVAAKKTDDFALIDDEVGASDGAGGSE